MSSSVPANVWREHVWVWQPSGVPVNVLPVKSTDISSTLSLIPCCLGSPKTEYLKVTWKWTSREVRRRFLLSYVEQVRYLDEGAAVPKRWDLDVIEKRHNGGYLLDETIVIGEMECVLPVRGGQMEVHVHFPHSRVRRVSYQGLQSYRCALQCPMLSLEWWISFEVYCTKLQY